MGIGLSGMVSGLDTDAIVKAMVSGQQAKATKVENKITLNKWTKEAWSGLNTKIYSFYTKYASKLRLQTSYMTRTASSSNESVVKATAGSGAALGTHSLQVKKLASSQYVTGGELKVISKDKDGNEITDANGDPVKVRANYNKNTKLTELVEKGTIFTITGKKGTEDEEVVKLEVTDTTTINDFLNTCKEAGLVASFDTGQQRFFISSSESGLNDKFSITTSELNDNAIKTFDEIDRMINKDFMTAEEKKTYEEAINTLRTNTKIIEKALSENYDPTDKIQKAVRNAIDTVEKFAVEHVAEKEAIRRAELIGNESIDTVIKNIFANIPETSENNNTEEIFAFYDTKYSEKSLAELKEKATNTIKSRANIDANSAIKSLQLNEDDKTYNGIVLNGLTKQRYESASKYLEKNPENGNVSTAEEEKKKAEEELEKAEKELETLENSGTATEKEIQAAEDKVDKAQEKLSAVEKNIEEAENIIYAWENVPLKGKDAKGNPLGDNLTLAKFYEQEYEQVYKTTVNADGAEIPDDDTAKSIQAEMKNLIISENRTKYDAKIAEIKNKILTVKSDDNDYAQYKEFIEGPEGTNAVKNTFNIKLENLFSNVDEDTSNDPMVLAGMGLGTINSTAQSATSSGMVVVEASDAKFVLDGAEMTETSNSFTVNGLTLNLSGTTQNATDGYDTVQITVGKDVDSTYKLVKEAITEYNKLLEEMNTLYNADSARGYDPLTDEQKESMSETDIENWEKKIKDSLLRRDDTLGSLLTGMRNALATSYTDDDGKTYSLSTYGIVTGHYTEKGKLHIYGDEEDGTYATYSDRLKAALEDDPDKVMETLTHIFGNLYSTMTEKCAKTEISSALTFYNDKQYNNLLKGYEDDLDILEDRIKELEDRYYKQFTAMEKAMSVLQNQSNSLASLLGTGGQ